MPVINFSRVLRASIFFLSELLFFLVWNKQVSIFCLVHWLFSNCLLALFVENFEQIKRASGSIIRKLGIKTSYNFKTINFLSTFLTKILKIKKMFWFSTKNLLSFLVNVVVKYAFFTLTIECNNLLGFRSDPLIAERGNVVKCNERSEYSFIGLSDFF